MAAISTRSPTCWPTSSRSSAMTGAATGAVPAPPGWRDDVAGGAGRRRGWAVGGARDRSRGGLRHEQRRELRAVSAGPSSRIGARRDPARAGVVRPGRRLRRGASPGAGAGPGGDGRPAGRPPRWSASGATWPATTAGTGWRPRFVSACAPPPARCSRSSSGPTSCTCPTSETLAALAAPVRLLVSEDGLPFFAEITGRLGQRLGVDVATTPGTHAAYHDHPHELAETRPPIPSRGQRGEKLARLPVPRRTACEEIGTLLTR